MVSHSEKKKIELRLKNIYKNSGYKKDIKNYQKEITDLIQKFNKKKINQKLLISEKTSMVICYGDSLLSNNHKYSLRNIKSFYEVSKKVYSNRLSNDLGYNLIHPNIHEFLNSLLKKN